ncbi:MAG: FAD-dependent oxidoreductase [Bdellovibrionaceae bacterium]|nr:FAD-dependent oxidoreductase [Pseudobdellovibrionaceae bacterium]
MQPLILEQASQFGGNCKGESIGTNLYSLGPAYISIPETNSPSHRMLNEIGVLKYGRVETAAQKEVFLNGKVLPNFWSGAHESPTVFAQMKQVLKKYKDNPAAFNHMSVNQWLRQYFPHITTTLYEYFQYYAWSSFGGTLDEIAAGEFLSWQASEQNGILVFPGGNSLITQLLFQNLRAAVGPAQLRTKSAVLKVIPGNGFVDVVVEESLYKLKTIRTKFVVMAAPKFVAKKIISPIPANQLRVMDSIEYRSFMVGNVTLRKTIPSKGFDLYCLKKEIPKIPTPNATFSRGFTDVIFSNWAQGDKGSPCTLTFYKAFPYQGARQFLLSPFAHNKHRDFLLTELQNYYPELGITNSDIGAVRMTLWGHSVPVCQAGLASSKELALASQPIGNIVFANQDNLVSPAYESSESTALEAANHILRRFR